MANVSVPMSIKTFRNLAERMSPSVSLLVRGDHGVGKSQIIYQLAQHFRTKSGDPNSYPVIDKRLSQQTEGDLIGLPEMVDGMTRFNQPDWYVRCCKEPCVLFLDELNRVTQEVMQGAFQIVLDRELNGMKLHPETRVYAAINHSHNYQVNEIDPALQDRFWVCDLQPTKEDWLSWARETVGAGGVPRIVPDLADFIDQQESWLDPPKNVELGSVTTSRRSWERLSDQIRHMNLEENMSDPSFYSLTMGFMGVECATALIEFVNNPNRRITGEEILNTWKKKATQKKVEKLGHERLNIAIEKVCSYIETLDDLTDVQVDNLNKFNKSLPDELKMHLYTTIITTGQKKENFPLLHKAVQAIVDDVIRTYGLDPNDPKIEDIKIPEFMKAKAEEEERAAQAT